MPHMQNQSASGSATKFWRIDMVALASLVILLWLLTFVFQSVSIDSMFGSVIKSESDAWMFALSGGAMLLMMAMSIASAWPAIIGIPTVLLFGHLLLARVQSRKRWLLVGGITAAVFIGVPIALNHAEEARYAAYYQQSDANGAIPILGRAVELPSGQSVNSQWFAYPRCDGRCASLLADNLAASVTQSWPGLSDKPNSGPVELTYRLGQVGTGCVGSPIHRFRKTNSFRGEVCPHLSTGAMPKDRLILTIVSVAPMSGDVKASSARRLVIADARKPSEPPATKTHFLFHRYPSLLHIWWKDGAVHLRRMSLPLVMQDDMDKRLLRAGIARNH